MRKLIAAVFLTLDGVMEASEEWQPPYVSEDVAEALQANIHRAEGGLIVAKKGLGKNGVAGSGKSSLINQVFLPQHPTAVVIDQAAVGTSTRSNPATYTGIMDDIRKAFAAANGAYLIS